MSLSQYLAPHTSSLEGITDDVWVSTDRPTTLNNFCEFQEGEDLKSASELDMSVKSDIEHHEIVESEEAILQETCAEVIEPTKLEFNNYILSVEYESFLCGLDVNVGLDVDLYAEYESFSFDPIQTDLLFESIKSELVESDNLGIKNFALDQTLAHIEFNRLVDFALTVLPNSFMTTQFLG